MTKKFLLEHGRRGKTNLNQSQTGRSSGLSGTKYDYMKDVTPMPKHPRVDVFSPMEKRVMKLVAHGLSDKEIGVELSIKYETVKSYSRRIREKIRELGGQAHSRVWIARLFWTGIYNKEEDEKSAYEAWSKNALEIDWDSFLSGWRAKGISAP